MLSFLNAGSRTGVIAPQEFPHLHQGDTANPMTHCYPTALSNIVESIKHLSPRLTSMPHSQIEARLAEALQTDRAGTGTRMDHCLSGLETFLQENHLHCEGIEYEGPMTVDTRFRREGDTMRPTLETICESLTQRQPLMAVLGWYYYDGTEQVYKRSGSHAVTIVAMERPCLFHRQTTLLVRDPNLKWPNPWHEPLLSRLPLKPARNPNAILWSRKPTSETRQLPLAAAGFHEVGKVFPMKPKGTVAILEGVVRIRGLQGLAWAA